MTQPSEGISIGRAYEKIKTINDQEKVVLNESPGQIRDRFSARRLKVLTELEPNIRRKVEQLLLADADE